VNTLTLKLKLYIKPKHQDSFKKEKLRVALVKERPEGKDPVFEKRWFDVDSKNY
jgi:hypothetical protein